MTKWYDASVFYHLYPLGCTGAPADHLSGEGGNGFRQLMEWIPYLQDLGFNALYIGPLFESSSHGYDTKDYRMADSRLGTNEELKPFISACHHAGIKVVIDAVFNHTCREFFAFRHIMEEKEASPYRDWYRGVSFHCQSPLGDPFCYEAWQGHWELPCLNLKNPEVKAYIFETVRFWINTFDIDGLRLDCANVLDFDFMKELRQETEQMKEDFWLMGEVIHGEYDRWVNPEMLHSVTNYALHKALYSAHNDHNYFEIAHNIRRLAKNGIELYTFTDNHDEDRLASKLADKAHLKPLYLLLFTLPGIPSIYYGSEWGIEGKRTSTSDKALRPAITAAEAAQNSNELTDYIRRLIQIHRENGEFHRGLYQQLALTNRQYAFARYGVEGVAITAVNNDSQTSQVLIPLPICGARAKDLFTGNEVPIQHNCLDIHLEANSGTVIKVWDALMDGGLPLDKEDLSPEQMEELLGDMGEE